MKTKQMLTAILATVVSLMSAREAAATVRMTTSHLNFAGHDRYLDIYRDSAGSAKKPGILLVPEYWGKDDLDAVQAKQMAEKGYVVLVLDIYGENRHTTKTSAADRLTNELQKGGLEPILDVIAQSVSVLKSQSDVDGDHVAGVGFGYGGGLLFNFAKRGDTGLKAVVSFYGGVKTIRPTSQIGKLPALLYVRPDADDYTVDDDFDVFLRDMKKTNFDLEVLRLPKAQYGFINKGVDSYGGDDGKVFFHYNAAAAQKAWTGVFNFLHQKI